MGCFLACFGSSKDAKRQKQRIHVLPRDQLLQRNGSFKPPQSIVSQKQESAVQPINLVPKTGEKLEERLSSASRKKVTFDSYARTYEPISVDASTESLPETTVEKAKEKNSEKSNQSNYLSDKDSKPSSLGSFPPNHRYRNCRESDDEEDEMQLGDSDRDVEDDEYNDSEDEEDEDILGSNTKFSPGQMFTEEIVPDPMSASTQMRLKTIGANPNARDRSAYVHPVLNPVENLSQWKALKGRGTPPLKLQKENLTFDQEPPRLSFSMEPCFKPNKLKINEPEKPKEEIEVNASLSNWLVSAERTTPSNKSSPTIAVADTLSPQKGTCYASNSPRSQEDRPILGALTLDEIRRFSASNSPRRSPSRSPDDMPILGTVGTYWSHTGSAKDSDSASSYEAIPNTTRKYSEDKRVKWHSTPFEARLDRDLNKGVTEA